ncbi:MAG: UDP-glucose/GDP-mannose dehydrogenase family protein [Candidatus Korarchaeota archaeon]
MIIAVIGGGYVGLTTALCFTELGHNVYLIEKNKKKLSLLNEGRLPIQEPLLDNIFSKNRSKISFNEHLDEISGDVNAIFIAVGTPTVEGRQDLSQVENGCVEVGRVLKNMSKYCVVVIKSTVLPTSVKSVIVPTLEKISGKKIIKDFGFAVNPEFLRQGNAVNDFMHPDRIVIGAYDEQSFRVVREIFRGIDTQILEVSPETALMIKYATNAMLALRISFINEIGNICKKIGVDVRDVARGIGMDRRISPHFLNAGIGFGGSCLPKDVQALKMLAADIREDSPILDAILKINQSQSLKVIELLKKYFPSLKRRKVMVLGLAYKPNTDDVRESRSTTIIKSLLEHETYVIAHDPLAADNFKELHPDIKIDYVDDPQEGVQVADAVIIATEWPEYSELDYSGKIVIDGRGIKINGTDVKYEGVCW